MPYSPAIGIAQPSPARVKITPFSMLPVVCPYCGTRILVPPAVQGRPGVCFGCGQPIRVPSESGPEVRITLQFDPGTQISGRYIIEERLGRGGMGVVYRARDTLVEETVALKFMNPHLLRTQRGQQLFVHEAQIARRLRHDNIIAVHDAGCTEDGILFISMELALGQPLRAFLRTRREERRLLDVRLAVAIMRQILGALEYAHRTVVHRDMKPENVMLLTGERIKVLDFGLAKAMDKEAIEKLLQARPGGKRVLGTMAYAAPEQVKLHEADHRSDLYSAGLILHELLTLRTPIDEPARVGQVRQDVAPSITQVLDKALQPERSDRWQSAAAFRQALVDAYEASYRPVAAGDTLLVNAVEVSTADMVYFDGGAFQMGNNGVREEAPEHEAYVEPFFMDKRPVTNAEYRRFALDTGRAETPYMRHEKFRGDDQPVVGVSLEEARAYAAWAGKQLPTEEQWEFAARGKENRKYPWGALEPDSTLANYGEFLNMPSGVEMHEDGATPEGILDMAGNVWEWTESPFLPYGMKRTAGGGMRTPMQTVRGGSWESPGYELRCSFRRGMFPETRIPNLGFRCVLPAGRG